MKLTTIILNGDRLLRYHRLWAARARAVLHRLREAGFTITLWSSVPEDARAQAKAHHAQSLIDRFEGPCPPEIKQRYSLLGIQETFASFKPAVDLVVFTPGSTPRALRRRAGERVDRLFERILQSCA